MLAGLGIALVATIAGSMATYLYDEDVPLGFRLASGIPIGLSLFGLLSFFAACIVGLTTSSILLSLFFTAAPLTLLGKSDYRDRARTDLRSTFRGVSNFMVRPEWHAMACLLFYSGWAILLWVVFSRVMIQQPDGIYTGVQNNLGDLPFHLAAITRFTYGGNFPPEDPTFAGARFTYPFIADFVSAAFVTVGCSLRVAMLIQNLSLAIAVLALLHRLAREITSDWLASLISPTLTLLGGGFGWVLLLQDAHRTELGIVGLLNKLPRDYSLLPSGPFRWGNAITCLLTTQRSLLLGLPLAVIAFTQMWRAIRKDDEKGDEEFPKSDESEVTRHLRSAFRGLLAGGIITGLLPLIHLHSWLVVMGVAACLTMFSRQKGNWFVFFAVALVLAVPQMLWSIQNSVVDTRKFLEWHVGWDGGDSKLVSFWLLNTGAFTPLLIFGLFWPEREAELPRRFVYWLPFALCFILPNLLKLAPWVWDNIKVLFYWYVGSAPIVSVILARFWRKQGAVRAASILLFISLTAAGALDTWRVVSGAVKFLEFDREAIAFARAISNNTAADALICHAPVYDHPVFLSGRRSLMGYPGHIWTHGIEYSARESDIKKIYSGSADADLLVERYRIDYIVVGPQERREMRVDEARLDHLNKVVEEGEYGLYRIPR